MVCLFKTKFYHFTVMYMISRKGKRQRATCRSYNLSKSPMFSKVSKEKQKILVHCWDSDIKLSIKNDFFTEICISASLMQKKNVFNFQILLYQRHTSHKYIFSGILAEFLYFTFLKAIYYSIKQHFEFSPVTKIKFIQFCTFMYIKCICVVI